MFLTASLRRSISPKAMTNYIRLRTSLSLSARDDNLPTMALNRRAENTTIPAPYLFPPSGTFDGNDGSWSTFVINIGDNGSNGSDAGTTGQNFKVHISTSGQMVWIPLEASWCTEPDQSTCAEHRGVQIFDSKQSLGFDSQKTQNWTQLGLYSLQQPPILQDLQYTPESNPNGSYGLTTVGLGIDSKFSPQFGSILVAGINTEDFFMGSFGLSDTAFTLANKPYSTFLADYSGNSLIPSLSYGYTAGAQYRNSGVPGNLVFGGYDQSRCRTGITIPMPGNSNSSLIAGVQSILVIPEPSVDSNQYSMTSSGFLALIDSTLPYLWLPQSVCDKFADRFQLTWDNDTELYLVNDTSHAHNQQQNATVSFTIGATAASGSDATSIVLPYAAFDLQMGFPIFTNSSRRYFPIKRSPGPYILGRAFLQETYLIVNYENFTFTVAPATFSNPMPSSHLVPIYSNAFPSPQPSGSSTPLPKKSSSLGAGVIAGIAIGAAVAILLIIGIICYFVWRHKQKQNKLLKKYAIDTLTAGEQVKERRISELASNPPGSPPPRFSSNGGYWDPVTGTEKFPPAPILEIPLQELESPPEVPELESQPPSTSPGQRSSVHEYFDVNLSRRRREARGEAEQSLGDPPVHELHGDDSGFIVEGQHFEPVVRRARASGSMSPSAMTPGAMTPGAESPGQVTPVTEGQARPRITRARGSGSMSPMAMSPRVLSPGDVDENMDITTAARRARGSESLSPTRTTPSTTTPRVEEQGQETNRQENT